MSDKAMEVYLNDHLAGATFGSDLARQIESQTDGTPLGATIGELATQIADDRRTLSELMERMGVVPTRPSRRRRGWRRKSVGSS